MINKISNKFIIFSCLMMIILPIINVEKVYASSSFTIGRIDATELSVRQSPGGNRITDTDGSTIWLYRPRVVEILGSKNYNGEEWKRIYFNYYSNNYTGWVAAKYLTDIKSYTTDDNYANTLRNAGFSESYILPLQKLHAIHPKWNFVASKNGGGLNFQDAVNAEYSPVYKNLISGPTSDLRSTDGAAYNNGVYKQFEPGWYAPSKQTIGFFMDPRNWLNDNTIFMFEQLSYNQNTHSEQVVQQVLNGSFMSGSFDYNGGKMTYAHAFYETGKQRNVSPVHLASRVLQEQGNSGNSATINMKSDGKTYYNFFNINAYGSDTSTIVANALSTAKTNGWDNPYSSIYGGAGTISNGYISVGQDTIYYQKFNTIYNASLYSHQYMANVRVLPTEAYSIYTSYYKNGLVDSPFTFKIPVYNNMPNETTLSTSQNGDNALKSLSVSGCNLNPGFSTGAVNYTCNVSESTKEVTINAEQNSKYASLEGKGKKQLNNNETKVEIKVTASNGDIKVYTITIKKIAAGKETPSDIVSALGYNNYYYVLSKIELGADAANVISNIKNNYSLATVIIKNKNNENKTSGSIATGDKLELTSNGQTVKYTFAIKGDTNGDGKVSISDLALVKSHLLNTNKLDGAYIEAADINKDGKISVADLALVKSHLLGTYKITK